ncbi:unnamed protein product [Camellia sinensis]
MDTAREISLAFHGLQRNFSGRGFDPPPLLLLTVRKKRDDSVSIVNVLAVVESYDEMKDHDDHTIRNCKPPDEVEMEEKMQIEDHAEINCPAMDDSPESEATVEELMRDNISLEISTMS